MTVYIERIVTEVVMQPEKSESVEKTDQRWLEKHNIEAVIKQQHQRNARIHAEGLDD